MQERESINNDLEVIKAEAMPIANIIDDFVIRSHEDATMLLEYSKKMKWAQKMIEDKVRPLVKEADKHHKNMVAFIVDVKNPYVIREKTADAKYQLWARQERQRAEERAREAQRIADEENRIKAEKERKRMEEERINVAAELEKSGFAEEAQAMVERPVVVSFQPSVPKPIQEAPKVQGVSEAVLWSAVITDPLSLCAEIGAGRQPITLIFKESETTPGTYEFSNSSLNNMAKALKSELRIPGVTPVKKESLRKRLS